MIPAAVSGYLVGMTACDPCAPTLEIACHQRWKNQQEVVLLQTK
jgi:hypothetical protein